MRSTCRPLPQFIDQLVALDKGQHSKSKGARSAPAESPAKPRRTPLDDAVVTESPRSSGSASHDYLTVSEVALILRFTERHVRKLIAQGTIRSYAFETAIRIRRSDLDHYIDGCSRPPLS